MAYPIPTMNEWLQALSDEDVEWAIKEFGSLDEAYEAELSDYYDRKYDEWRDDKLFED